MESKLSRYTNENKQQTSTKEIYITNEIKTWKITMYFIYNQIELYKNTFALDHSNIVMTSVLI